MDRRRRVPCGSGMSEASRAPFFTPSVEHHSGPSVSRSSHWTLGGGSVHSYRSTAARPRPRRRREARRRVIGTPTPSARPRGGPAASLPPDWLRLQRLLHARAPASWRTQPRDCRGNIVATVAPADASDASGSPRKLDDSDARGRICAPCTRLRALWGDFPVVVRVRSGALGRNWPLLEAARQDGRPVRASLYRGSASGSS
jgi:hypothetical protein